MNSSRSSPDSLRQGDNRQKLIVKNDATKTLRFVEPPLARDYARSNRSAAPSLDLAVTIELQIKLCRIDSGFGAVAQVKFSQDPADVFFNGAGFNA